MRAFRNIALCVIAFLVIGCVKMSHIQQACEARGVPFSDLASCIRSDFTAKRPAWTSHSSAPLLNMYLAWLDAAADRVARGERREVDARLGAAALYERIKDQEDVATRDRAVQMSNFLAGYANYIRATTPLPATPSRIINCTSTRAGTFTHCW